MKRTAKHEKALEKLEFARRAWQQAARPNDERDGFDYDAMDALVNASEVLDRLDSSTQAEACNDILSRFFPPSLTDGELDYTWLCVYWRASEFRSCMIDLQDELSDAGTNKGGDQYVSVERYHQEMETIRQLMTDVSEELKIIRHAGERSGVTFGAFGISVPLEEIRATLNRLRRQIDGESGLFNLTKVVDLTGQLYKSTKHFLRAMQDSPMSAIAEVFQNSKAMVKSAGEALLVSLRIKKDETKPPKLEVRISLSGTLDLDDRTAIKAIFDISTRMEAIVAEYNTRLLDRNFFYRLESEFGRFEYLVWINEDQNRINIPENVSYSEADPSDSVLFTHKAGAGSFSMSFRDYSGYLILFIRDIAVMLQGSRQATVDLSKYGAILTVRKNTEYQSEVFED